MFTGGLNADLCVIPVTAKALHGGSLVDLAAAFAEGCGVPSSTCRFDLDGAVFWLPNTC